MDTSTASVGMSPLGYNPMDNDDLMNHINRKNEENKKEQESDNVEQPVSTDTIANNMKNQNEIPQSENKLSSIQNQEKSNVFGSMNEYQTVIESPTSNIDKDHPISYNPISPEMDISKQNMIPSSNNEEIHGNESKERISLNSNSSSHQLLSSTLSSSKEQSSSTYTDESVSKCNPTFFSNADSYSSFFGLSSQQGYEENQDTNPQITQRTSINNPYSMSPRPKNSDFQLSTSDLSSSTFQTSTSKDTIEEIYPDYYIPDFFQTQEDCFIQSLSPIKNQNKHSLYSINMNNLDQVKLYLIKRYFKKTHLLPTIKHLRKLSPPSTTIQCLHSILHLSDKNISRFYYYRFYNDIFHHMYCYFQFDSFYFLLVSSQLAKLLISYFTSSYTNTDLEQNIIISFTENYPYSDPNSLDSGPIYYFLCLFQKEYIDSFTDSEKDTNTNNQTTVNNNFRTISKIDNYKCYQTTLSDFLGAAIPCFLVKYSS